MLDHIKKEIADELNGLVSKLDLLNESFSTTQIQINNPPPGIPGDYTIVLFPFIKILKMPLPELGNQLGLMLKKKGLIADFSLIKGFLNIDVNADYWLKSLKELQNNKSLGLKPCNENSPNVLIEYPSPNTNKPLHLGHLRNIFLGASLSQILESSGYKVIPVCLFNDRGTNICKSMVAWKRYANGETPESISMKGDHFVGKYYVKYADADKKEKQILLDSGVSEEEAKNTSIKLETDEMLLKWESNDTETRALWNTMNNWVYDGMEQTFKRLGISFKSKYYESEVYNLGKESVSDGLQKGVFTQKPDGAVWIDLTDVGLDEKIVLRSNGTSIYITQDIAVAYQKQKEFDYVKSIYVVGNEQDYHFKVLFEILKRLGMKASDQLYHLSYGMVELPTGKMKSREGTVVDADDLIDVMCEAAREKSDESGKNTSLSEEEKNHLFESVGLGALRYFILKVDPKKKMIFNPEESIDLHGNTGPFIQYTHARICSVLRNADAYNQELGYYSASQAEKELLRWLSGFSEVVFEAANRYEPSLVANYIYETAKLFNRFYHENNILKEEDKNARNFRILLSEYCGKVLKKGLNLLCMEAPEKM